MIGYIILGAILLFLVFLLTLKVTVTVAYASEVELWVKVLLSLFPKRKRIFHSP